MLQPSLDTCRRFGLHLQHTALYVSFSSAVSAPDASCLRQVKTQRMVHVSVYWACAGLPLGGALSIITILQPNVFQV